MRILHTSDWHLGKPLEGRSRRDEQQAFLEELVRLVDEASIDLVLLAGDVFDVYNPPAWAEELFYQAVAELGAYGQRGVVVIAGNHDSPDRLAAPHQLAKTHGVFILGRPDDTVSRYRRLAGQVVEVQHTAPSFLKLRVPRTGEVASIAALPYPSESRLGRLLVDHEATRQRDYAAGLARVFDQLSEGFDKKTVNLAMSHLYVDEARASESERELVGGADRVQAAVLPKRAQYTALGHLHEPQDVWLPPGGAKGRRARYSGAPLAFRMSERDSRKSVTIVDVVPGKGPEVELVPIAAGRPMVVWEAESLAEVHQGLEQGRHVGAWCELVVRLDERPSHADIVALRKARDFLRVRVVLPPAGATTSDLGRRRELPMDELFRRFARSKEVEPTSELVKLFEELAEGAGLDALLEEGPTLSVQTDGTGQETVPGAAK